MNVSANPTTASDRAVLDAAYKKAFGGPVSDCIATGLVESHLENLEYALGAHQALDRLVTYCTQRTDGQDWNIPVPPEHMAALLQAANAQMQDKINAFRIQCMASGHSNHPI